MKLYATDTDSHGTGYYRGDDGRYYYGNPANRRMERSIYDKDPEERARETHDFWFGSDDEEKETGRMDSDFGNQFFDTFKNEYERENAKHQSSSQVAGAAIASVVGATFLASIDPNDPIGSAKKGGRMVACVLGIIGILVLECMMFLFSVFFSDIFSEEINKALSILLLIISIVCALGIIKLIRIMMGRPPLLGMIFDRSAYSENATIYKYEKKSRLGGILIASVVVLLILFAVVAITIVFFT